MIWGRGALPDVMGVNGGVGGGLSQRKGPGAQPRRAVDTGVLELGRRMRNARCSGEMHRYRAELRLRRQHAGSTLTLRHESVGIEQD